MRKKEHLFIHQTRERDWIIFITPTNSIRISPTKSDMLTIETYRAKKYAYFSALMDIATNMALDAGKDRLYYSSKLSAEQLDFFKRYGFTDVSPIDRYGHYSLQKVIA